MDQNWVKVFSSYELSEIELIRSFLLDREIEAIILNKQDSMYITINNNTPIELYVQKDDVIKAKHYIAKQFNND